VQASCPKLLDIISSACFRIPREDVGADITDWTGGVDGDDMRYQQLNVLLLEFIELQLLGDQLFLVVVVE